MLKTSRTTSRIKGSTKVIRSQIRVHLPSGEQIQLGGSSEASNSSFMNRKIDWDASLIYDRYVLPGCTASAGRSLYFSLAELIVKKYFSCCYQKVWGSQWVPIYRSIWGGLIGLWMILAVDLSPIWLTGLPLDSSSNGLSCL